MTGPALDAQFDAHDALVRACLDGTLSLLEFAAAYADFPARVTAAAAPGAPPTLQRRLAFHTQVAGVMAGTPELEGWLAGAVTMRLRHLATRYPEFRCGG